MTGAGTLPAGAGYAGGAELPPTADRPGSSPGVAFVDQSGDYQVNGTGDVVKTTPTRQRALNLLRIALGSATLQATLGLYLPTAIDQTWEAKMRQSVARALSPMVDDATIRIDRIDLERPLPSRAGITVTYTVLATGEAEIAAI